MKETNPIGFADDVSDTRGTGEINDGDAADDDTKVDNKEIKVTFQP